MAEMNNTKGTVTLTLDELQQTVAAAVAANQAVAVPAAEEDKSLWESTKDFCRENWKPALVAAVTAAAVAGLICYLNSDSDTAVPSAE